MSIPATLLPVANNSHNSCSDPSNKRSLLMPIFSAKAEDNQHESQTHYKQNIMERCNNSNINIEIAAISSDQTTPFPSPQHKKYAAQQQQPRYLQKMENISLAEPSDIYIFGQRSGYNNISLAFAKDRLWGNKRAIIIPKKIFCRDRNGSPEQKNTFIQIAQIKSKNQYLAKQKHSFSAALKQIEEDSDPRSPLIKLSKTSDRAQIYQPFKKKSLGNQKDKLKPIVSSSQASNDESSFFSIQKMPLLDIEKNKKSKSLIVHMTPQNTSLITKSTNNPKTIKNLNFEKGKIPKASQSNDQLKTDQDKKQRNVTNSALESQQLQKTQLNVKRNIYSAKVDNQSQFNEAFDLCFKKQKQQQYPNESQSLIQVQRKDIQIRNKLKRSPVKLTRRKFIVPFETYYYRDLLWKVNYTNCLYVEVPVQYEHRLKVFVGKGNNSCMVSGLIARRPWYAFTDRVEQANFVWTQIKILSYYKNQEVIVKQNLGSQLQVGKYKKQSILTDIDQKQYKKYFLTYLNSQEHNDERLQSRAKLFKYQKHIKSSELRQTKMHNHLINNYVIGNKKALFNTMANYYQEMKLQVFDFLPLTFHIKDGLEDKKYFQFLRYYHKRAKEIAKNNEDKSKPREYNAWIVKPGENSNRGNGIKMCLTLQDIKKALKHRQKYNDGSYRTNIIQAYIQRPLLYHKRKFDLRHYMMITCINGYIKGYWYKDGYVRTTSSEYSLVDNNGAIHLTNDAVQKNLPDYGRYEKGNKISYDELAAYIDRFHSKKGKKFYEHVYPKMQRIGTDAIRACSGGIDPSKLSNNFQIFGLDFMIDSNLDVWLIEINTNPCLELSCPLLSSIIPKFIENTLELTLDCMFPPPVRYTPKGIHYFKELQKENRFSLVYDERCEKLYRGSLQVLDNKLLEEQDDTFEDCGNQWQDN